MTQPPFTTWCPELEQALAAPFPAEVFEPKKKGQGDKAFTLDVLSWVWYEQRLNDLVGVAGWHLGEPMIAIVKDRLVMRGSLTILGVTKWQIAGAPLTWMDRKTGEEREIGDAEGGPEMNAFGKLRRRLCGEFGLGFYLLVEQTRKRIEKARREGGRAPRRQSGSGGNGGAPRQAPAGVGQITMAQRNHLVEIAENAGWSKEALKHYARTCGFDSTLEITTDRYEEICKKAGDRELGKRMAAELAQTAGQQGDD